MRIIELTASSSRKVAGRPLKDYESKEFFAAAKAVIETEDSPTDALARLTAMVDREVERAAADFLLRLAQEKEASTAAWNEAHGVKKVG
jgi:hypothetical protein